MAYWELRTKLRLTMVPKEKISFGFRLFLFLYVKLITVLGAQVMRLYWYVNSSKILHIFFVVALFQKKIFMFRDILKQRSSL